MTSHTARVHVIQCCEDAKAEIADERWETAALLLRDAADTAEAQGGATPELRTVQLRVKDPGYSVPLERGLRVLGMFDDQTIWRLSDLADRLGLARSTTHRYLTSLVALGQIERTRAHLYRRAERKVR